MRKRIVVLFLMMLLMAGAVIVRILVIDTHEGYVQAAGRQSIYTLTVSSTRGTIYDCKLRPLAGQRRQYRAVIIPSSDTIAHLTRVMEPERVLEMRDSLTGRHPFVEIVDSVGIEGDGVTVFSTSTRYSANTVAAHVLGYLDSAGHGVSGIERVFDAQLADASGEITAVYRTDASGSSIVGMEPEVSDTTWRSTAGIALTIDADIQQAAEDAADEYMEQGAVVILELPSGAVRACVSRPDFMPDRVGDYLQSPDAPLINRAFAQYDVGSVFKTVATAAALEEGISPEHSYCCEGCVDIGGTVFNCNNRSGHGEVDMAQAFAKSCNTYFISLAGELGADRMLEYARRFGFGEAISLTDGYQTSAGILPDRDKLTQPAALANMSFGQGELMATPMHIAAMTACIANGGVAVQPYIYEGRVDEDKNLSADDRSAAGERIVSEDTARRIREYMRLTVTQGTGKPGESDIVTSAAKTGTAQTGMIRDGRKVSQAWYAGFFPYEQPKYVCVVLVEGGESGGGTAGPIFREIAERIK